ncbi:sulfurtransferase-like selenium metabolism protein YedF [Peptostreptococcus equinus]|uniref:Sulfurtransferase-like selenium metabolism protein YedF n=1 Tax=Peptostreptococcus equinus TaxID=3003601 RepID=A0ABY7JPT0_9FIRM|nr:sulfurtransferase-like selenium metabolism protein YedF [Peptostreptococcus sp. CBA3647]WAW14901.1 sulfurtransferase-like selenium metabolism protein YedF [Peptostreptococcus sp. CBA3647]
MSIKVDARGQACPLPVINTKKALESIDEGVVEVRVDDLAPKENVIKFAKSINCQAEIISENGMDVTIKITKSKDTKIDIKDEDIKCDISSDNSYIVAIMSNKLGNGNEELGHVLIKSYLFALTETNPLPKSILFLNGGVELTTINNATVENIKILEEKGVEILSCGTCLDYYELKQALKVGSITNMYTIIEKMNDCSKVITLG